MLPCNNIIFCYFAALKSVSYIFTSLFQHVASGIFWSFGDVYNGRQYGVSSVRKTWLDAKESCEQDDATLAVITSEEEHVTLSARFVDASIMYVQCFKSLVLKCLFEYHYLKNCKIPCATTTYIICDIVVLFHLYCYQKSTWKLD